MESYKLNEKLRTEYKNKRFYLEQVVVVLCQLMDVVVTSSKKKIQNKVFKIEKELTITTNGGG
jgi:hypothetical protein